MYVIVISPTTASLIKDSLLWLLHSEFGGEPTGLVWDGVSSGFYCPSIYSTVTVNTHPLAARHIATQLRRIWMRLRSSVAKGAWHESLAHGWVMPWQGLNVLPAESHNDLNLFGKISYIISRCTSGFWTYRNHCPRPARLLSVLFSDHCYQE